MGDELAFRWAQARVAAWSLVWRQAAEAYNEALTDLIRLRKRRR